MKTSSHTQGARAAVCAAACADGGHGEKAEEVAGGAVLGHHPAKVDAEPVCVVGSMWYTKSQACMAYCIGVAAVHVGVSSAVPLGAYKHKFVQP